jgi:transcriptional repressor NrdR
MRCPYCHHHDSKVIDTTHDSHGGIRRRRECLRCGRRFSSLERPVQSTPLVVKQDGTREEFERGKLERGIRIACAKRPVSAADIERLIGQVESTLQNMGKSEVSSRVVGDLVIKGLKEMDLIAYIRYASVYLKMDDLRAIRNEIDRLLLESGK